MSTPPRSSWDDRAATADAAHFARWEAELRRGRLLRAWHCVIRFCYEGVLLSGAVPMPEAHACLKWLRQGGSPAYLSMQAMPVSAPSNRLLAGPRRPTD